MLTPAYILDPVRDLLGGIELDPCSEPDNPTGADRFYAPPQDGCSLPWHARSIWVNPPYGSAKARWVERCIYVAQDYETIRKIVLMIPAHTETRTFQTAMLTCESALLIKSRLSFGIARENGRQWEASHGSALFGFNVDLSPLRDLGAVVNVH